MKKFIALMFLCVAFLCGSRAEAVIRIGAFQFRVAHGNQGTWNTLNTKYEKLLADMLSKTGLFELVPFKSIYEISDALVKSGREPDAWKSILEAGRIEKCRYIFTGQMKLKKDLSSATIDFQLFDILTEEAIPIKETITLQPSQEDISQASQTSSPEKTKSSRSKKSPPKKKQSKADAKAVKEQLIAEAFNRTVEILLNDIAENRPMVTAIRSGLVLLNRGKVSGVKPGDIYRVYTEKSDGAEDIFGTGYKETTKTDIAFVQVRDVLDGSSAAEIFQNAGNIDFINEGDKIAAVTPEEAQNAISSGAFDGERTSTRPITANAPSSQHKTSSATESLPPLAPGTIRIGIMKFDNKADNVLDKEAGAITDLCTRFLSASDKIAIVEYDKLNTIAREHRLNLSGFVDSSTAAQLGKFASCQYILMGSITNIEESHLEADDHIDINKYSGRAKDVMIGLGLFKYLLGGGFSRVKQNKASITIDARLVNVTTSRIEITSRVTGEAVQTSVEHEKAFKYKKSAVRGGLQSQAIDYASANLGLEIREKLLKEYPRVSAVDDINVTVNIGSSSGVHEGNLLRLASSIAFVTETQPDYSVALVIYPLTEYPLPEDNIPKEGEVIFPRLYNEGDFPALRDIIDKANSPSSAQKAEASSAKRKPVTFDKSKFEMSSTNSKKVITSYGLSKKEEKSLLEAHSKAAKMIGAKKKYEAYMKLAQSTLYDYLASYNAAKYAFELSMFKEAEEFADKALLINPEYKPAKALMTKIKRSGK